MELKKETQKRMLASIQHYFQENMEEEVGDLKAMLLLEFIMKEIGPAIYNQAVSDAQAVMQNHVNDLDGVCYASDDGFWKKK